MEYYINMNPKTENHLQKGDELELSMVERNIQVTVTRTEGKKVFFEATGEDGEYLKNLYEEQLKRLVCRPERMSINEEDGHNE